MVIPNSDWSIHVYHFRITLSQLWVMLIHVINKIIQNEMRNNDSKYQNRHEIHPHCVSPNKIIKNNNNKKMVIL